MYISQLSQLEFSIMHVHKKIQLLTSMTILVLKKYVGIPVQQTMDNGYCFFTGTRTHMQQGCSSWRITQNMQCTGIQCLHWVSNFRKSILVITVTSKFILVIYLHHFIPIIKWVFYTCPITIYIALYVIWQARDYY